MRGQHRAHQRVAEPARHRLDRRCLTCDAIERVGDAPALRPRARKRVGAAAAVLMHVLGEVRKVREIAERAHDIERVGDGKVVQYRGERFLDALRVAGLRATKTDRGLADRFDALVSGIARLRAQDVAQQASEKARVFAQRQILVVGGVHRAMHPKVP